MLFLLQCTLSLHSQSSRKFDRKRWKELVKDIDNRRYDPNEMNSNYESKTENEYYNKETNNEINYYNDNSNTGDNGIKSGDGNNENDFFSEENDSETLGDGSGGGNGDGEGDEFSNGNGGTGNGDNNGQHYNNESKNPHTYTPPQQISTDTEKSSSAGSGIGSILLIIALAILIVAIVFMILQSVKDKNKKIKSTIADENKYENLTITKSELELALEAALKDKNFREAVRIYFIAVIKEMKDKRWIKWERKKTNYHYIDEIHGRSQQTDFITATRAFEVVWYGNRNIAEYEYKSIEPVFVKLLHSINS